MFLIQKLLVQISNVQKTSAVFSLKKPYRLPSNTKNNKKAHANFLPLWIIFLGGGKDLYNVKVRTEFLRWKVHENSTIYTSYTNQMLSNSYANFLFKLLPSVFIISGIKMGMFILSGGLPAATNT